MKKSWLRTKNGTTYPKRVFENGSFTKASLDNHHVRELTPDNLDVFTIEERDGKKRKVKKTYIYDKVEKYVIVLEQQRNNGFYLLTAYHLNKEYGLKALEKKMKRDCRHHYKTQDPNCIKGNRVSKLLLSIDERCKVRIFFEITKVFH